MKGKISAVIAVAVMATVFTACAKKPPACGDDATLGVVRNIIMEQISPIVTTHVGENFFSSLSAKEIKENLIFELPRASAFDDKIAKYSCEAKLKAGNRESIAITYTSQLDDKGAQIVSIDG